MDANKLQVLRDLHYKVHPICGLCVHSVFPTPNNDWGTCGAQQYEHKKHTGPARQLSIVKYGSCANFEPDPAKTAGLGHYQEFLARPTSFGERPQSSLGSANGLPSDLVSQHEHYRLKTPKR